MTGLFIGFWSNDGCTHTTLGHFSVSGVQLLVLRGNAILMEYKPTNTFFLAFAFSDLLVTKPVWRNVLHLFQKLHLLISECCCS